MLPVKGIKEECMPPFNERLTELMKSQKITQKSLSETIGASERMIRYYITGQKEPTLQVLIALADFFNVSLDYLTGRSDVMGGGSLDQTAAAE